MRLGVSPREKDIGCQKEKDMGCNERKALKQCRAAGDKMNEPTTEVPEDYLHFDPGYRTSNGGRQLDKMVSLIDLPPTAYRTESLHLFAAMANPGIGYNVLSDSVGYDRETLAHNVLMGGQGSTLYPSAEPSLASARVLQLDGHANAGSSNRVGGRGQRRQSGRGRGGGGRRTSAERSRAGGRVREGEGRGSGRGGGETTQTASQAPLGRGRGTPSGGPSAIGQRGKGGTPVGRGNGGNAVVATGSGTTP
ncbi:hypothetical protein B0H14DRAFT_3167992, partial [Mycena olivaceomarginata]